MKTPEEIQALKNNWLSDPCWDIEDTGHGFEDHYDELLAFRLQVKKEQEEAYRARIQAIADKIDCSYNTAEYLDAEHWKLKQEISRLEERVLYLEKKLGLEE